MRTTQATLTLLLALAPASALAAERGSVPASKEAVARSADAAPVSTEADEASLVLGPEVPTVNPAPAPEFTPRAAARHPAVNPGGVPAGESGDDGCDCTERHWYGYQTFASDGIALGAMLLGAAIAANSEGPSSSGAAGFGAVLAGAGVVTYMGGAAVVHGFHGRTGAAVASIGMRVGLPFLGGALGAATAHCSSDHEVFDFCPLPQMVVGAFLGGVTAMVADGALLSHESIPRTPGADTALRLAPSFDPQRKSAGVAVAGAF